MRTTVLVPNDGKKLEITSCITKRYISGQRCNLIIGSFDLHCGELARLAYVASSRSPPNIRVPSLASILHHDVTWYGGHEFRDLRYRSVRKSRKGMVLHPI